MMYIHTYLYIYHLNQSSKTLKYFSLLSAEEVISMWMDG